MKGKKSQMVILGIMIAVMSIIVIVQLINPIKDQIITARDSDHLNCTSTTNSVGIQSTCIFTDLILPYFIGTAIVVGIGYIGYKKLVAQ